MRRAFFDSWAVERRVRQRQQRICQPDFAGAHAFHPFRLISAVYREGCVHCKNAGDVRRAGAQVLLLPAADLPARELKAAPRNQRAHALWRMELMRADAVEVARNARKGKLAERLHAVRMEHGIRRAFLQKGGDGGKVVDRADFVVDVHERNERGFIGQRLFQPGKIGRAILIAADQNDFGFRGAFQRAEGFVDGRMFDNACDDPARAPKGLERAENGHVVRLRAAGGKIHFVSSAAERLCQTRARAVDRSFGFHGGRIRAGGVIELFGHRQTRRFRRFRQNARGGAVVEVNHSNRSCWL
ncbi:hypothetical protein SDC9_83790 [bioreactor metagenome]|uniref:Uncharacterized protein n=1 Tax=bioreactor metagenome TaxID=1076179 RepID=A0A644ZH78_9ZZZZ